MKDLLLPELSAFISSRISASVGGRHPKHQVENLIAKYNLGFHLFQFL